MYRITNIFLSLLFLLSLVPGLQAQEDIGFRDAEAYNTSGAEFADTIIAELMTTLEGLLKSVEVGPDFSKNSRIHFWRFFNRLDKGKMTESHNSSERLAL